MAEDLRHHVQLADHAARVRVQQQLVGVVHEARGGVPGSVHAQSVALPGHDARHVGVPQPVTGAHQADATLGEGIAGALQEHQVHRIRLSGHDHHVDPIAAQVGAQAGEAERRQVGNGRRGVQRDLVHRISSCGHGGRHCSTVM